mgnify:CR=1 FL=1
MNTKHLDVDLNDAPFADYLHLGEVCKQFYA